MYVCIKTADVKRREKQHLNPWQWCGPSKFDLRMCFKVCLCFGPAIKKTNNNNNNKKKNPNSHSGHPGTFPLSTLASILALKSLGNLASP